MSDELKSDFKIWVGKYLNGTANKDELNAIEDYYTLFADEPDVFNFLSATEIDALDKEMQKNIQTNIKKDGGNNEKIIPMFMRYSAAACLVICAIAGLYFYLIQNHKSGNAIAAHVRADTIGNKAILFVGKGRKIVLNEPVTDRQLAESGTGAVSSGDKINYTAKTDAAQTYNTLYVPRGGRFKIVLGDGTQVILNASSSLTYPTKFNGAERKVQLTGEGYFEVTKDALHPFIVSTGSLSVKVLGTKFNVNSYRSMIRTTLEEGKVLVKVLTDSVKLTPGEQARYAPSGNISKSNVDVDIYTGWIRNEVIFDDATTLADAMEVLGREYNYEISFYDPELKNIRISADIDKADHLLTILDYIKKITHVTFDVNQTKRTVIVKKAI